MSRLTAAAASWRHSMLFKAGLLWLLLLLLCIPLGQIKWLIDERGRALDAAASELARTHVGRQTLAGPILVQPYTETWEAEEKTDKGETIKRRHSARRVHLIYPQQLDLQGTLSPQERYRGIFTVPFYRLKASLRGQFAPLDESALPRSQPNARLNLHVPVLALAASDLRGLEGAPSLHMGDPAAQAAHKAAAPAATRAEAKAAAGQASAPAAPPGSSAAAQPLAFAQRVPDVPPQGALAGGIHAHLPDAALAAWRAGQPLPFALALTLQGQRDLAVLPLGGDTTAHITSTWPHPSFGGRFLAAERSVGPQGFDAHWRITALTTRAREQYSALALRESGQPHCCEEGGVDAFSISLAQPVNVYSMAARAAKYGALFIALVLMAVFMVELFKRLHLHPVQYGLAGLSIAVFFLLLVALSEKTGFALAYASAASASVALLATYFSAVLGGWRRGLPLAAYVALLYATLYGLLASEDNALLLGALLVFGMLAALMLATRHVNWWRMGRPDEPPGTSLNADRHDDIPTPPA